MLNKLSAVLRVPFPFCMQIKKPYELIANSALAKLSGPFPEEYHEASLWWEERVTPIVTQTSSDPTGNAYQQIHKRVKTAQRDHILLSQLREDEDLAIINGATRLDDMNVSMQGWWHLGCTDIYFLCSSTHIYYRYTYSPISTWHLVRHSDPPA